MVRGSLVLIVSLGFALDKVSNETYHFLGVKLRHIPFKSKLVGLLAILERLKCKDGRNLLFIDTQYGLTEVFSEVLVLIQIEEGCLPSQSDCS